MKKEINIIMKYFKNYFVMFPFYGHLKEQREKIKNSNVNKLISINLK